MDDRSAAEETKGVEVEAYWKRHGRKEYGLALRLINNLDRQLVVAHSALWRGNMLLLVADPQTGEVFEELEYFDDLPAGSTEVPPGGVFEREVDLHTRFPDLWRLEPDRKVLIVWNLEVPSSHRHRADRVGGFVEVAPGSP